MASTTIPKWKRAAIKWAETEQGKHACKCGCGKVIKVTWNHFYKGVPSVIRGHWEQGRITDAQKWIDENQGKHFCQCGCGQPIPILIHHHVRGIPRYLRSHVSNVVKNGLGKIGNKNSNYKAGRYVDKRGYVQVLQPGPGRSKYKREHRIVMENKTGRELHRDETIHHRNRIKSDNSIDNLEVISRSEHARLHAIAGETGVILLKARGIVIRRKYR